MQNNTPQTILAGFCAMLIVVLGCSGCEKKSDNGSTKQESIAAIVKKNKGNPRELTDKLIVVARKANQAKDVPRAENAIAEAAKAAESIRGDETRAKIFTDLASVEYAVGEPRAAKKSVNKVLDAVDQLEGKAEVQATYLIALAKMLVANKQQDDARGQLATAEEKAAKVESIEGRIIVLSDVAAVFAQIDDAAEAKRVVASAKKSTDSLPDKSLAKAVAIAQVAAAEHAYSAAESNKTFDEAIAAARTIEIDYEQVNALHQIAEHMVSVKENAAAHKLLTKAKDQGNKIKDDGQRTLALSVIDKLLEKIEKQSN